MNKIDINIKNFQDKLIKLTNDYIQILSPGVCLLIIQKLQQQVEFQYISNINTYNLQHPIVEEKIIGENKTQD